MSAAEPAPILVDGDARDAVEHALHRNLFVEAGAGTGKTTVLVRRVVRLFATGTLADASGLVAITFTEAAAAELRDRIRAALERAAVDRGLPAAERERCLRAARTIDDATITTLHGFAQRILAEHPLEAGLPPAFEVEEGIPAELAFVERWRGFLDDLLADEELADDLRAAITLGLEPYRLAEVARAFHDRWDRLESSTLADPGPLPAVVDLTPIIEPLRTAVALGEPHRGVDDGLVRCLETEAEPALQALEAAAATGDRLEILRVLDMGELPTGGRRGRKELWGADPKAAVLDALVQACEARFELLGDLRRQLLERLLPRIADFTLGWAHERARAGTLHFHDLLVLARRLLWTDAGVRALLAERFRVLLVDESQDTDPIQVELVVALAAGDPAAPLPLRWEDVPLGEGRLLVVGDPKQSIYGFRGADVTLWNRVRARFGDDVVTLSQNFRSVATILDWVNGVFEELIGAGERPTQPPYVALDAARREAAGDHPPVEAFGGPGAEGRKAADIRLDEAADVAAAIGELHGARGVRHADIALLLPTRTPLGPIERALDSAGIPYRVESRSLVWETDVVRELLAVLTAIEDPADEVAVVAALRAPAFACRDDELVDYRRAGGSWDPTSPPPADLPQEHPVVTAMAWLRLRHQQRWWVPVNELVERVVRERRMVELTFAQRRPRDHWRRLRFVIDQARAFVEAGGRSLAEFLSWAALQGDEGAMAVETVVPEPDDDAVRILTVHGSKGLEFPVVVLAGLTAGGGFSGTQVLWGDERPEVRITVPYRSPHAFMTADFDVLVGNRKQAEDDEAVRLLYVAATRARDHLLVSVHHKAKTKSHAQLLHERCEALSVPRRDRIESWQELTLLPSSAGTLDVPPSTTVDQRATRLTELEAVLRRASRPWAVAPTALHECGVTSGPMAPESTTGSDAGDDDSAPPEPGPVVGDAGERADAPQRRGGSAVGRAVHAVLERVDLSGTAPIDPAVVTALATAAADEEDLPPDAVATVAELARSALESSALTEARAAGRLWREVPVVTPVGDRLVEGFVDLLHEAPDGRLVVVDWKTDAGRSAAELHAAADRYRLQGAGYALALGKATGRRIARVRFVFCRAGGTPAVEIDVADLDAAIAEAEQRLADAPVR